MCDVFCLCTLFTLAFVLISAPVYVLFVVLLIKMRNTKPFDSPFYHIITWLGLFDLLNMFHLWGFTTPLFKGHHLWLELQKASGGLLLNYLYLVLMVTQRAQYLLLLTASLNRFVALVLPLRHATLWTPRNTNLSIALSIALSVASNIFIPFMCEVDLQPSNNQSDMWVPVFDNEACFILTFGTHVLLTFILSILFIVLYSIMFVSAWRRAKLMQSQNTSAQQMRKERASRNLALIGCVLSSLVVAGGVHTLYILVLGFAYQELETDLRVHDVVNTVQWSLFGMSNPWLVILLSPTARNAFKHFLHIGNAIQPAQ